MAVVDRAAEYELIVVGQLSPRLLQALPGFEVVEVREGRTRLRGWVADQPALQGVLRALGDLCIELDAVRRVDAGS